nr:hypothetical protein [Tanacetum cinerariifolium]
MKDSMIELRETFQAWLQQQEQVVNPDSYTPEHSQCRKIHIYYNDDDDEESSTPLRDIIIFELSSCIAITPVLSTEEPVDSLIMEEEHLDTIPATKSDEVIKSSVEDLVPIPSDSEGILDNMKFDHFSFFKTPKVLLLAWDRVFEIKNDVGNKQYKPDDVQELFRKLLNDVQSIHEELAEYINIPSWNHPALSSHDDDDYDGNYTIPITPKKPDNSLSMRDEHLNTILVTKSDEVIKSSIEDLVPIPSESEGILDNTCDVPFRDNSPPLDVFEDQFEEFSDSNDDSTSIDDDYFSIENINYIELSPLDSELALPPDSDLVSLEEVNDFDPKDGEIDTDILLTIKDDILHEKLLNIILLIAKIKALKDNPTPSTNYVLKSPFSFLNSFLEETDTSDNSLP